MIKTNRIFCLLCWIVGLSLAAALTVVPPRVAVGAETLPDGLKVISLDVYPAEIQLQHRFDYRQLLITGRLESGETVDVTRMAELVAKPTTVQVGPTRLVRPAADGEERLTFRFGEHSVEVPVRVAGAEVQPDVSFVRDVQPAFSRMSCNAGTCHGSKDGKNGFKLSLRGYDPLYDHRALTDDIAARRFNRAAPEQSLMLLKATGSIPHVGGVRTKEGEPHYELVKAWIASGAKLDLDAPRVASIEVMPQDPILPRAGLTQQMVVLATYHDGSVRDVTADAFVESGNIEVVEAGDGGMLTMLRRGEAPVLVRYEGAYAATTLTVMGDRSNFVWQQPPTYNYIDELVYDKLQRVKVQPSELCTDDEFIRRVFLDLTGLPPTEQQVREFLTDSRDSQLKRDELVDRLIGGREYVEHWTNKWADMLQVNRKFLGEEGAVGLRNWIKDAVATNKPYDQFAYEVLTASGSTIENPPASYYKALREPDDLMENTTHLFLAVRFNCNKCHDHPFERWTQDQYYHLAAFFAQIGRKEDPAFAGQKIGGSAVEGAKPLVEVVFDSGGGEVKHDRTGEVASPRFPYQEDAIAVEAASRREQLARWMTAADNQYFASSYVNRLWGYLFGVGIIEPIDDIRAGNPPTNPALLEALTKDFVDSGFDIQHMLRTICKSRTYQHSIRTNPWNEDDEINYSRAIPRRLPAEVLFDAIHWAAGSSPKIPGMPAGMRAAELPDAGVSLPFLDDFGRPVRESSCECERSSGMVLGPIMKLVNGPTITDAVSDPQGELAKLVASTPDDRELIESIFLRFLARYPTEREVELGLEAMQSTGADFDRLKKRLDEYTSTELPRKQAEWEKTAAEETTWSVLKPVEMSSQVGATFEKREDQSIFVSGKTGKDVYTITASSDLTNITGVRLEALPDAALAAGGPGRAKNGNFVLSELRFTIAPKSDPGAKQAISLGNASAAFSQQSWAVAGAVDGNEATGWAIMPEFNKPHTALFETREDAGAEGGSILTFELSHQYPDGTHSLGRFRLSVTNSPRPIGVNRLPEAIAALLAIAADERTDEQRKELADHYRSLDGEYQQLVSELRQSEEQFKNRRSVGVQDLAWALINTPSFLFNR